MVIYIYKAALFFFLPKALWDVKLPCSFPCICKKTGNLSDLFLSLKGKDETSSNLSGLKKCWSWIRYSLSLTCISPLKAQCKGYLDTQLLFGNSMPTEKKGIRRRSMSYWIWGWRFCSLSQNFNGGVGFFLPNPSMLEYLKMKHLVQHEFRDPNLTDFV